MLITIRSRFYRFSISIIFIGTTLHAPANGDIAQIPLETVVAVEPNVMLFIDNSPSMGSLSTHSDYDPEFPYPHWQISQQTWGEHIPARDDDYVFLDQLLPGNCPEGFVQGVKDAQLSCLKLRPSSSGRSQYTRRYLDFLFETFTSGTDLSQQREDGSWLIPGVSRLDKLKQTAADLAADLSHTQLCLASFAQESTELAIHQTCTAEHDQIHRLIDAIELNTHGDSPLGKVYLQIWEYFKGIQSSDEPGITASSPVRYRCQGNGIVLFSDGIEAPEFTLYNGSAASLETAVQYAEQTDLYQAEVYDDAGRSFGDGRIIHNQGQITVAEQFAHQNIVGFFVPEGGTPSTTNGAIFNMVSERIDASRVKALASQIQSVLRSHSREYHSAAPIVSAIDSSGETIAYRAIFHTTDWTSSIEAYRVETGSEGNSSINAFWDSDNLLPVHQQRNIMTITPQAASSTSEPSLGPILFLWNQLQNVEAMIPGINASVVAWIRGDRYQELSNGGRYRDRDRVLGDIVHTKAAVLPVIPDQLYPDPDYRGFIDQMAQTRTHPIIFFGGNDGFLHGFTGSSFNGEEVFALAPWTLLPDLVQLTERGYRHRFFFDGPLTLIDAKLGDDTEQNPWRSILLATFGAGAKGLIALDVTDPRKFEMRTQQDLEDIFLWEINPTTSTVLENSTSPYAAIGHLLSSPSIVRTRNSDLSETWYAVTGNGIGADSNQSMVYIIDLKSGRLDHSVSLSPGVESGITSVTPVDLDHDSYVDRLYAADLSGKVWRLDWNTDRAQFENYYHSDGNPVPLFSATGIAQSTGHDLSQPIVSGFEVGQISGKGYEDGVILYFGTGKFYDYGDLVTENAASKPVNSVYALWDSGSGGNLNRDRLVNHDLIEERSGDTTFRFIDGRAPLYTNDGEHGWVLDLRGHYEQVLHAPKLIHGRIQFTTLENTERHSDPCTATPNGWTMEADAITGQNPPSPVFDLNLDGELDSQDYTQGDVAPSGIKPGSGSVSPPAIVQIGEGDNTVLIRLGNDADGELWQSSSPVTIKRQSWRTLE
jgi:hypothetical protein